jgi:hypothetical protein
MGRTKGAYTAEYPPGTLVRIADRLVLEEFLTSWPFHHPLTAEQLAYAGVVGKVLNVDFYHGGDELYAIEGAPGMWHEALLEKDDNRVEAFSLP